MPKPKRDREQGSPTVASNGDGSGGLFYDIEREVVPVKVRDKDGKVTKYELKEATGDAACRWRNAIISKTKLGPDGKAESMKDIADTEPLLVSLCLFRAEGKKDNVPEKEIRSWPARVQRGLFAKAKEISPGIDETEEDLESAKNEPESTPGG